MARLIQHSQNRLNQDQIANGSKSNEQDLHGRFDFWASR
jgi:hypothetical protein